MKIAVQFDRTQGFARQVFKGLLAYKQARGHWSLLINPFLEHGAKTWEGAVDGVCVIHAKELGDLVPASLKKVIYVGSESAEHYRFSVSPDNTEVGRLAAQSFHRDGYATVGFYQAPQPATYSRLRGAAFSAEADSLGMTVHAFQPTKDMHASTIAWLRKLPKPVAIFADNDYHAFQLSMACELARVDVPRDVAILGVDNDELLCEASPVPLSSIDHGSFQMGWETAAMLIHWIESGKQPSPARRTLPPPGVQMRASTGLAAIGDPFLGPALRFIRANTGRDLRVEEVVRKSGTNRRTLERRFRDILSRGIQEEIQLTRIDAARQMLSGSELSLGEIAEKGGFGSGSDFSRLFRRCTGQTPSEYRRSINRKYHRD